MKLANPIVMLGLDAQRKPHAARFDAAQIDVVRKAATLMGMRLGWPKTEEAAQLVAKLPLGKLFAAGRGLVPLVKGDLHKQLMEKLELEPEKSPAPSSSAGKSVEQAAANGKAPGAAKAGAATVKSEIPQQAPAKAALTTPSAPAADPWDALMVGDKVIAAERHAAQDGWWPCVIVAVSKNGEKLTLRWLDNPKQPEVTMKRRAVALLPR